MIKTKRCSKPQILLLFHGVCLILDIFIFIFIIITFHLDALRVMPPVSDISPKALVFIRTSSDCLPMQKTTTTTKRWGSRLPPTLRPRTPYSPAVADDISSTSSTPVGSTTPELITTTTACPPTSDTLPKPFTPHAGCYNIKEGEGVCV